MISEMSGFLADVAYNVFRWTLWVFICLVLTTTASVAGFGLVLVLVLVSISILIVSAELVPVALGTVLLRLVLAYRLNLMLSRGPGNYFCHLDNISKGQLGLTRH